MRKHCAAQCQRSHARQVGLVQCIESRSLPACLPMHTTFKSVSMIAKRVGLPGGPLFFANGIAEREVTPMGICPTQCMLCHSSENVPRSLISREGGKVRHKRVARPDYVRTNLRFTWSDSLPCSGANEPPDFSKATCVIVDLFGFSGHMVTWLICDFEYS